MKTDQSVGAGLFVTLMLGIFVMTVGLLNGADTQSASDWGVEGSGTESMAVTASSDGAVTVAFPAQAEGGSMPEPLVCDLIIGGSSPDNMFTGDLAGKGYSGARFKINGDGTLPAGLKLIIFQRLSRTIRTWAHDGISVSSTPGEWRISQIPLVLDKGWFTTYKSSRYTDQEMWDMDLADVQMLLIRIVPSGMDAQTYSITDFQLTGPGVISEPAVLTPLQAYFGVDSVVDLTDDMRKIDSDGDGMSDYNEILAGLNPYDASSVLAASVALNAAANTVSWQGVFGATYGVMRSNNLLEGFQLIAGGRKPSFTGEIMTFDDTNPVSGKPNYYKVVKY